MPRTAKRPGPNNQGGYQGSGDPGGGSQAPAAPTGMPYGEHQASIQAQQQIPLPQAPPPGGPPVASPGGPPVAGGNPLQAALQAALQQSPPSGEGLLAPSIRPNEPVTAGLASGPGPGPEALGLKPPMLADHLEDIARDTNDPAMARLAQLARTMSGHA